MTPHVLIVDDDTSMCEFIEDALTRNGFNVTTETSPERAIALLRELPISAIATDLNMRQMSGIDFCQKVARSNPDVPVIVITAFGSMETAIEAIRAGAYDFLTKPFTVDALGVALARAVEHHRLRCEVKRLKEDFRRPAITEELVYASETMARVRDFLSDIAESSASVLVTGESGTGKELVARALHRASDRTEGPFVAVDCGSIPEHILESELFGHAKGAFTDAHSKRRGLFAQSDGGTLFLDEVGNLTLPMQAKVLRVLQERRLRPVGSDEEIQLDFRLISATNRDLDAAVEEKRFREDLFFRINVIHVHIPPLRSRAADVLVLGQHFIKGFASKSGKNVVGLSPEAARCLLAYPWPGNVRELQNCVERAVTLARYDHIGVDDLPEKIINHRPSHVLVVGDDPAELVPLEEVERRYVARVVASVGGNKTLAARILGVDRKTLYRKLERWSDPIPENES